ncbi:protein of unknown function (plasmid) [Cupriavidus taiwanensis]|nr:protein of unknown function [Cupriavidus taiwanensis]SPD53824.1 protein of unknown function [Cupriavidus taiwanensis]
MMAPPESPDRKRQMKNQLRETGSAHAKNAAVAVSIIQRMTFRFDMRAASKRPDSAPTRYPAKFAAPSETASAALNQWA